MPDLVSPRYKVWVQLKGQPEPTVFTGVPELGLPRLIGTEYIKVGDDGVVGGIFPAEEVRCTIWIKSYEEEGLNQ